MGGRGEGEELLGELFFGWADGRGVGFEEFGFARFFNEFFGVEKGGQVFGNSVEGAGAFVFGTGFFGFLDFLPLGPNFIDGFGVGFAEDVGMAAQKFVGDVPRDGVEIEGAAFVGELAMEDDLEQKIAEFFGHFVVVAGFDGVHQFIDFLDGVEAEAHVILFAIPRAAGRGTKARHDFEEIVDGGFFGAGSGFRFHRTTMPQRHGIENNEVFASWYFGETKASALNLTIRDSIHDFDDSISASSGSFLHQV